MNLATRTVWSDLVQATNEHLHGVEWSLNSTISVVRRRWKLMLTIMLVTLGITATMLAVTPPEYTSKTLLQINTRQEQVTTMEDVVSGLSSTDAAIRTEVDVLKSRKLAQRVIEKLNLLNTNELRAKPSIMGYAKMAVTYFLFPSNQDEGTDKAKQAKALIMTRAVDVFLNRLEVTMLPRSYSIEVAYTAYNPEMAGKIANTVANEYLTSQLEDKFDATRRANEWMNGRLKQLQREVQQADLAVQKFREEHNLTQARGVTLTEQQLSELNSQLILARTKLAEAQAKTDQAQALAGSGRGIDTASEVLNNPLIQNLRIQETEVRRKMSDLAARYGARHPQMITVQNELGNVRAKIREESDKIRGSLVNEVAVAQARVKTLEQQLEDLQTKTRLSTDAEVQLAELERQSQAERGLYESFLARSKQIAQMDMAQSDARVIYPAETPLSPSKPKKLLIIVLAGLVGAMLGVAAALGLEALDSGFRTTQHLESSAKVAALGMLGELPADVNDRIHYVVDKPTSAFTEGVRAVRTALQFSRPDKPAKVILVTSSVPQEGKSMFSISLAQASAAGGQKVLLIDADMRRPSVSKQLGLEPKLGLAELLVQKAKVKDVIIKSERTGLHILPALPNTQFAQELITSNRMKELMSELRDTYDMIVVDSPPVMAVADSIALSPLVDAVLFMVRWGTTPRQLVLNSIKQLQSCNVPLAGVVMTRVDMAKQQAYGYGDYGYYYGKYKEYYTD